jgi:hypothetical protein
MVSAGKTDKNGPNKMMFEVHLPCSIHLPCSRMHRSGLGIVLCGLAGFSGGTTRWACGGPIHIVPCIDGHGYPVRSIAGESPGRGLGIMNGLRERAKHQLMVQPIPHIYKWAPLALPVSPRTCKAVNPAQCLPARAFLRGQMAPHA